ncbi:MAG: cysteine--tRNA ligase [Candidatus Micrarchaeota archaeon]
MKLYNTLTKRKDELITEGNELTMYACGPTVYDYAHLGHARSELVFDIIYRYLTFRGFRVRFVHNLTDVDDKIIKRAREEKKTEKEIAERFTQAYLEDMRALGAKKALEYPQGWPRATEYIPQMVKFIEELVKKGFAYEADGDVYFEVEKFKEYGKLSGQPIEQLQSGARVAVGEKKKNPLDFALWKSAKEGEPSWESPWGRGRPGWHIECSTMCKECFLGVATIDIHGGGKDLIFPHHENEIAQSEARSGKQFARFWIHNGFININKEKMSKSLGNFLTIRDILKNHSAQAVRMLVLNTQYSGPIDFEPALLEQAQKNFETLSTSVLLAREALNRAKGGKEANLEKRAEELKQKFIDSMDDDFNSPFALAALFEFASELNKHSALGAQASSLSLQQALSTFEELAGSIGLFFKKKEEIPENISKLAEEREDARKSKDWKRADEMRAKLAELGYELQDSKDGVKIRKK